MGVKLKQAGIHSFRIFEQHAGPGGTWWANNYPGSEVDVHSSIYSYSFKSHNWTRTHAGQPELLQYIEEVVDDFGLNEHFRYNTRVTDVIWNDAAQRYAVTTADGAVHEAHIVVSAVGMLSDPQLPDWPGRDTFRGVTVHSSEWDPSMELEGKRVGVAGVGSTAVQIIPEVAKVADRLYVFQREPGWVLPIYVTNSKRHERAKAISLDFIDRVFKNRPDLKEAVTPKYTFSAKRRVLSDDYYPALLRDNVELVTGGVASVVPEGVVTPTGRTVELDVLVAATGFKASQYLSSLTVRGREGKLLADVWKDGAFALVGVMVPGFPNLYIMYGPNTNGGAPITAMLERQAEFVVRQVERMMRSGYTSIEATHRANDRYQRWVQGRMEGTAWHEGNNYFKAPNGKIVTQWRDGSILYDLLLRTTGHRGAAGRRVRSPEVSARIPEGRGAASMTSEDDQTVPAGRRTA
jgi:cation diffusion facilitator CzcD-associated flavoprotein CzcO